MGLNWNEIKSRALLLSKTWADAIEQAAQWVLVARAQFANSSLADLYDPLTMPPALLKAHQKLDTAYAYGLHYTAQRRYRGSEVMFFSRHIRAPLDTLKKIAA